MRARTSSWSRGSSSADAPPPRRRPAVPEPRSRDAALEQQRAALVVPRQQPYGSPSVPQLEGVGLGVCLEVRRRVRASARRRPQGRRASAACRPGPRAPDASIAAHSAARRGSASSQSGSCRHTSASLGTRIARRLRRCSAACTRNSTGAARRPAQVSASSRGRSSVRCRERSPHGRPRRRARPRSPAASAAQARTSA